MSEPIRILHVLHGMDMAGTETLLMNIYRNINRENVQFDFAVCAGRECAYDKEILSMGGIIIPYPRYKGTNHFTYVKWWNEFFKTHLEYKIIHGHIGSTAAIYLSIAKKHERYTIAHSHSTHTGQINMHDILYSIYTYPTRYIADFFFGCSKKALVDRYGKKVAEDSGKSKVFNNAIDPEKFIYNEATRRLVRAEYSLHDDVIVIGTVGRLSPQKNPFEIIRIVDDLVKRGLNFKFLWIGKGELEIEIKAEIKRKKLEDYFIMAGTRPDIYNVLQAMDIFVFPSVWEGLGISCVEAQAAGLPTLCSNTIPIEAKVTCGCKFLPLNDTDCWVKEIINLIGYKRTNCYQQVLEAGYDIKDTSLWLEKYYLQIYKNI